MSLRQSVKGLSAQMGAVQVGCFCILAILDSSAYLTGWNNLQVSDLEEMYLMPPGSKIAPPLLDARNA